MDQPDHDLLGICRGAYGVCPLPRTGVTWLASSPSWLASLFKPLANSDLGWLARKSQESSGVAACAGSPFVLQFFSVRFLLGLAEAGFYPGVIVYLTHWFPSRDRTKTLAWFFIGTPLAAIIGPPISERIMTIGYKGNPPLLGMVGWQWVFIFWGIPAVILGILVLVYLTDRPSQARWLTDEERTALEETLAREKHEQKLVGHMTIRQALANRKVLALAAAYFFVVTGSYGVEFYMASIHQNWYGIKDVKEVAYLVIIPAIGALFGQRLGGLEFGPHARAALACFAPNHHRCGGLALIPGTKGTMWLTMTIFTLAMIGVKAYLPAFWAVPSLFLTESAAAASIGLINSCGNFGGAMGPSVLGSSSRSPATTATAFGFERSVILSALIIASLGIGRRATLPSADSASKPTPEALVGRCSSRRAGRGPGERTGVDRNTGYPLRRIGQAHARPRLGSENGV